MAQPVEAFRSGIENYFEGPDPRLKRLGLTNRSTIVGRPGHEQYRNFGDFAVHRYTGPGNVRMNGAASRIAFIGMEIPVAGNKHVTLFSDYEDSAQLYRQVWVRLDRISDLKLIRVLDDSEAAVALDIIHTPLPIPDSIVTFAHLNEGETAQVQQALTDLAAMNERFAEGMREIEESERAALFLNRDVRL